MKQKINLRLGLIALVALILTTVGVTKVYYDLFRQQVGRDLRLTAHLLGQSGEFTRGNAPKLQDPEVRITWAGDPAGHGHRRGGDRPHLGYLQYEHLLLCPAAG